MKLISIALGFILSSLAFSQQSVPIGTESRPADLLLAQGASPRPLLLVLHGYGMSSSSIDGFFKVRQAVRGLNFHAIIPQGRIGENGASYWSATDACCDFFGPKDSNIDLIYLTDLIDEAINKYSVAKDQIYVAGFSNGGFMANRLACDATDAFAGIISFSGANFNDSDRCQPSQAINYLQVHGTDDRVIVYEGGSISNRPYPSASETAEFWSTANNCQTATFTPEALELSYYNVDLNIKVPSKEELPSYSDMGNETDQLYYKKCRDNTKVGLWTMKNLGHAPIYSVDALTKALKFVAKSD